MAHRSPRKQDSHHGGRAIYTVNLYIYAAVDFPVLPIECQFTANNFYISLPSLQSG